MNISSWAKALEKAVDKSLGIDTSQAESALGELALCSRGLLLLTTVRQTAVSSREEGSFVDTAFGKENAQKLKGTSQKWVDKVVTTAAKGQPKIPIPDDFLGDLGFLNAKTGPKKGREGAEEKEGNGEQNSDNQSAEVRQTRRTKFHAERVKMDIDDDFFKMLNEANDGNDGSEKIAKKDETHAAEAVKATAEEATASKEQGAVKGHMLDEGWKEVTLTERSNHQDSRAGVKDGKQNLHPHSPFSSSNFLDDSETLDVPVGNTEEETEKVEVVADVSPTKTNAIGDMKHDQQYQHGSEKGAKEEEEARKQEEGAKEEEGVKGAGGNKEEEIGSSSCNDAASDVRSVLQAVNEDQESEEVKGMVELMKGEISPSQ
eukprot:764688-Hanusia_phi.AAC.2